MFEALIEKIIGVAIVLLIAVMVWAIYADSVQWEQFKTDHRCKVVSQVSGTTFNTITYTNNGPVVGVASTPSKTGWQCDDGVTYYR